MANYYFFLHEFKLPPWEVDKLDMVLFQGIVEIHSIIKKKEEAEMKKMSSSMRY